LQFICRPCEENYWSVAEQEPLPEIEPDPPANPLNATFDIGHRNDDDLPEPMDNNLSLIFLLILVQKLSKSV
jgi:hypothetical protein